MFKGQPSSNKKNYCQTGLRRLSDKELEEIFTLHQKWLDSGGETGSLADLSNRDFSHAQLQNACLLNADLSCSKFVNADLNRANLENADIRCANLMGVKNLTVDQLARAQTLYHAEMDTNLLDKVKEDLPHLLEKPAVQWVEPNQTKKCP